MYSASHDGGNSIREDAFISKIYKHKYVAYHNYFDDDQWHNPNIVK